MHVLWYNNTSKYLIRVSSQSREASLEELASLLQRRGSFRAELRPVSGATLANLDRRRLRYYFGDIRQQDISSDEDEEAWQSLLTYTEVMTEEGISVRGISLFGTLPNHFLPYAGIDAVAYPGMEQDYRAKERSTLRRHMTPLLNKAGDIFENGLIEQA